ncbi:hypothetical protein EYF80_040887 [Liparis tanakae]|uniref:Uncharacterized protein n=1 Tax=Liparis tanakae TaxID=230148 RepID=A0A4Z2G706_9TELE|nr:hypothetical protein EYF80_040887 [Liparis tanakae]
MDAVEMWIWGVVSVAVGTEATVQKPTDITGEGSVPGELCEAENVAVRAVAILALTTERTAELCYFKAPDETA